MRRTVKIVSLVILGTVFLLWMTCSTELIARWRSTSKIVEIGPLGEEMMGLSFYQAANFEQLDTLFDTMRLEGYVYNISHATDDEATRSLLLASEKGCYQIELEELVNVAKIYYTKFDETPKSYTGFGLDFCPLGLEDGSYELLLQVEENGTPSANGLCDRKGGWLFHPAIPAVRSGAGDLGGFGLGERGHRSIGAE